MVNIDRTKFVNLLLHGHDELLGLVESKLIKKGFDKKQVVNVDPRKFAEEGNYVAQLWIPDKPTQLLVDRIIKAETKSPQKEGEHQSDWITRESICIIELFDK